MRYQYQKFYDEDGKLMLRMGVGERRYHPTSPRMAKFLIWTLKEYNLLSKLFLVIVSVYMSVLVLVALVAAMFGYGISGFMVIVAAGGGAILFFSYWLNLKRSDYLDRIVDDDLRQEAHEVMWASIIARSLERQGLYDRIMNRYLGLDGVIGATRNLLREGVRAKK